MQRTEYLKVVSAVVIYHVLLVAALILVSAKVSVDLSSASTYVHFDAAHYLRIAEGGYAGSSQAFFPMFPWLWRLVGLGVPNAIMLNGLVYGACVITLASALKANWKTVLLWLSLPSVFFCYLPYSEATFMIGATAMILGTRKNRYWLTVVGLLWCTLSRPAFTVLLPALGFMLLISEGDGRTKIQKGLGFLATSILGLLIVAYVQFNDTGAWGGFYSAQSGYGNTPHLPALPLTSWGGGTIVPLDAVALMVGALCMVFLLLHVGGKRFSIIPALRQDVALSLGYVAFISLMITSLHGGELFSLNRFIFASPFIFVLIDHFIRTSGPFRASQLRIVILCTTAFFLLFGSYVHIQTFLKFFGVSLAMALFLLCTERSGRVRNGALVAWTVLSFIVQLYFLLRFLSDQWVA